MNASIRTSRFWADVIDLCMVIGLGVLFSWLGWLASAAYWLCRDGLFEGQSVGKRLMGLKVVVQPEASRCTWRASFLRNVLWVIPLVNFLMISTAVYYWFSDPQGRHWGDRLANTVVIRI